VLPARSRSLLVSRIDAERLLAPLLAPAGITPPLSTPRVIVLDPGHGGIDPGAENAALRINEKNSTLDVAQRVKLLLEGAGYKVILTRATDRELSKVKATDLALRAEVATRARADLFISIHFNAVASDTRTAGTEVYTFAPQFQRSATSWGAGADNDAERTASPVNRFDPWSALLAHSLHRKMLDSLGTYDRGQKIKHLAVLRPLNCPAVLVECAFLSSTTEAQRVATPLFRQKIAEGIAAGVAAYAAQLAPVKKP
jgi:N-acetylmuramoyl-L-alanine amidase